MMIESKWISLRADVIAPETAPSDASWAMESPSPYDVPTHARSYYDPSTGLFTIEFKYISTEDVSEAKVNAYMRLALGKKSKRIYALHLDIHSFQRDRNKIAHEARSGIESFTGAKEPNRHIAIRAITDQQKSLMSAVA
jgi:hypothetical protein